MDQPCDGCGGDAERAKACAMCGGRKVMILTGCPGKTVPDEVWEMVQMTSLADTALPEGGGWNQQTAAFRDAFSIVKSEQAKCRREASRRGGG